MPLAFTGGTTGSRKNKRTECLRWAGGYLSTTRRHWEKLQTKQDAMQDLLNAMDEATQDSTQSSSRAALEKRGKNKGKPVFSHQDALEVNQLEIARLEEDYAEVVKELEDFEALKDGV